MGDSKMKDEDPLVLDARSLRRYAEEYGYISDPLLGDSDPRFPHAGDGIRARGYVLPSELYKIARWKSPRRAELVRLNQAQSVRKLTGRAFTLKDTDPGRAASLLDGLQGIGIRTASAVLAVIDPQRFGVVDYRVWNTLHRWQPDRYPPKSRNYWPVGRFLSCLEAIRELAHVSDLSCREVDMALWQIDRESEGGSKVQC